MLMDADFERTFRREYAPLVRALAVAWGSTEAAEDAVQEAFLRARPRWAELAGDRDPIPWIRRVAVNALIDQHRRRRTRDHEVARRRVDELQTDGPDGNRVDLARAVARLPDQQRLAVGLFYLGDLSVDDVAAALGIAPGTVKKHLHDARQTLRLHLEVPLER